MIYVIMNESINKFLTWSCVNSGKWDNDMTLPIQKLAAVFLALTLLILHVALPCEAQTPTDPEHRVVRVGWFESGEESEGMANSRAYYYEYLQAIAQYTGWSYEYVEGTWDECLEMLKQGKVDLLGFVQKNEERMETYHFPSLPMAITNGYLVTDSDSALTDAEALDGIRVGIARGNAYNANFEQYCEENDISVQYQTYPSISDIAPALAAGEIDAAVVAEEAKTVDQHILVNFATSDQYFATNREDTAFLRELDLAMKKLNAFCPHLNDDLYQKYFAINRDGTPIFTAAELAFIQAHPNILVLYDSGWPPIEYLDDETGIYRGISPDLFALLSEKCGIQFVYDGGTSGEVLAELQSDDQRNVLTTISYDYAWAEQHDVYITQPFITSTIVKLGKHPNATHPTVAINEKAYFTQLLSKELEGVDTRSFSKQIDQLEAVRTGEADYTFVTEDQANFYRSIPKYSNLKMEKMENYEQKICISVEKNSDPELISVVSKALACITHDEMTAIIRANTENAYQLTLKDRLYQNRVPLLIAAVITVIVVTALIFIVSIRKKKHRHD